MDEVDELIVKLNNRNYRVRTGAADALGKIGEPAVPALIKALKDEYAYLRVREKAADALVAIGKPAVPVLIEALEDKDAQGWAIGVLDRIKDGSNVPALIEALKDKNVQVRANAAKALMRIKDARVVPALIGALRDGNAFVRYCAAGSLAEAKSLPQAKGTPAVPALIWVLKHMDGRIRSQVAIALGKIKDVRAVPALIEALKYRDKTVRWMAAFALGDIANAKSRNKEAAIAVPALIEALSDKKIVRERAARVLGKILKNCKTIDAVIEFEASLQEGLKIVKKHGKKYEITRIEFETSKLRMLAAQRKNELAPKRDIILDDIPRPPKGSGKIYRAVAKAAIL
jgi:HEAT repeat protein